MIMPAAFGPRVAGCLPLLYMDKQCIEFTVSVSTQHTNWTKTRNKKFYNIESKK